MRLWLWASSVAAAAGPQGVLSSSLGHPQTAQVHWLPRGFPTGWKAAQAARTRSKSTLGGRILAAPLPRGASRPMDTEHRTPNAED